MAKVDYDKLYSLIGGALEVARKIDVVEKNRATVSQVGFSDFELGFNLQTGQPNSGTRQVIRDNMRNNGVVALKYPVYDDYVEPLIDNEQRTKQNE